MVEKLLLATAITFALNLLLGIGAYSTGPQAQTVPAEEPLLKTAEMAIIPSLQKLRNWN